uniref:F-box domain-containing protein n=1 Tax=Amphora coffeiformis TaxID=265554 RepID=A0A7S3L1B9_9STRA|mmetsp:Transcript_17669/g.33513  ORF Transcript_17669/g.33513 Transcript_17669/m.33513 type:complete len:468 (-) Transcript_17669:204-1607(-)|eukprot:scaffold5944_cov101-Amphora_coffeaeformis.AAC.4
MSVDPPSSPPAATTLLANNRKRGTFMNLPAVKRLYKPFELHRRNKDNTDDDDDEDGNQDPTTMTASQSELSSLLALLNPNQSTPRQCNLLLDLPEEVLYRITNHLDAPSLLRLRLVNTYYARLAARNEAGWERLCEHTWARKIHVCPTALALREDRLSAYRMSFGDATSRNYMHLQELLYDPDTQTGTVWYFRFKESAGADWTQLDPWWQGRPARQLVFLPDGTCQQYNPETKQVGSVQFGNAVADDDGNDGDGQGRNAAAVHNQQNEEGGEAAVQPTVTAPMNWRLLTRPMDLPTRHLGSYVRITVGGRDVPTYAVRRSPTGNWGFLMESCWGLFASFPLPARHGPSPPPFSDEEPAAPPPPAPARVTRNGAPMRRRLRRGSDGSTRWVWVREEAEETSNASSSSSSSTTPQPVDPDAMLRDDTHLLITNEIQWREAFLYNVGARTLPEGDEATDDFDRAWGGLGA